MKTTTLTLPVALAACALLSPGFAHARNTADSHGAASVTSSSAMQQAKLMVPAQAHLVSTLDARKIKTGSSFRAELSNTIHLKNGTELPRGTSLIGRVVTDHMQADGTSRLALLFTRAQLKNGKAIPIKATIVGYAPASSMSSYGYDATPANTWTSSTLQVDQLGAISGVDLHSKIGSKNSGVFVSRKKDEMRFSSSGQFALAIAARNNS